MAPSALNAEPPANSSASGTAIKIGFICSCTGAFGFVQVPPADTAQAWVKMTNANGGLGGHPIELITEDDDTQPGKAISAIQTLINDHVAAIWNSSNLESSWENEAKSAGIPVLQGTGFTSQMTTASGIKELWSDFPDQPLFNTSDPQIRAMNAAVEKYYPGETTSQYWNELTTASWAAGLLLTKAVSASGVGNGTVTAADVTRGLNSLKNETLGGFALSLTFVANQPHSVDCWFTTKMVNHQPQLVNNGKLTCSNSASSSS